MNSITENLLKAYTSGFHKALETKGVTDEESALADEANQMSITSFIKQAGSDSSLIGQLDKAFDAGYNDAISICKNENRQRALINFYRENDTINYLFLHMWVSYSKLSSNE